MSSTVADAQGTSGKPSLLLALGFVALPVVVVLTSYLDLGAWLFASSRAALFAAVVAGLLIGLPSLLLRDRVHGSLVGLCLLALLFTYQYPGVSLLLLAVAVLISANALLGPRGSRAATRLFGIAYRVIGVFGIALLLVTVVQFGLRGQITGFSVDEATAAPDPGAPGIWLVLLDGYPRADALERDWGFEGAGIEAGLEELGFTVSKDARSNYNMTKLTLPSLFNMALLEDLEPWSDYDLPAQAPVSERVLGLQHNRAFDLLREHGYHLTSLSASYRHEDVRAVDDFIDAGTADVMELLLLGRTAIGAALQAIDPWFGERQLAERVETNLETMASLAVQPSERPRFVFTHIPAPHPPYAFATSDRPTIPLIDVFEYQPDLLGDDLMRVIYREHVDGLRVRVLDALASVVEAAGDEAVIIVMSDHGPRPGGHDDLSPEQAESQFAILLAARTPDGQPLFESDAMASDVLSTVANRYLGTDIPGVERVFESNDGLRYPE